MKTLLSAIKKVQLRINSFEKSLGNFCLNTKTGMVKMTAEIRPTTFSKPLRINRQLSTPTLLPRLLN